ncbi:MAG: tetratricopeptide repeat protein [Verrucomicrobia bacterium]|nr:tetratricopeptide repeat protein [Verrucomicrobiota bacterium]
MAALTPSEEAQLQQTIEMFRVITQSQPLDYQSLEILKEAYMKLGMQKDVVDTSKRIAEAYVQLGQLSSAIMEYETILQRFPDDPDVRKALTEIENKTNSFAGRGTEPSPPPNALATEPGKGRPGSLAAKVGAEQDDGKAAMQRLFVDSKLVNAQDFGRLWFTPGAEPPMQVNDPFLQVMADKGVLGMDKSLKLVIERARIGYLPLDKYEIDNDLGKSFPRAVCLKWCILPFDRMSKSVLVATANPFNKQAAAELQAATPSRLLWYMTSPPDLVKAIKKIFR